MERTFAGFWRDGAVVLPEYRHADATGFVIRFSKNKKEFSCCHAMRPSVWSEFYWLDTTPPTELTPQEAFELMKVVFPMLASIEKDDANYYKLKGDSYTAPIINWGEIKEYPQKKWRAPIDSDKGRRCRTRRYETDDWSYDMVFIAEFEGKFLAKNTSIGRNLSYDFCEVLDK